MLLCNRSGHVGWLGPLGGTPVGSGGCRARLYLQIRFRDASARWRDRGCAWGRHPFAMANYTASSMAGDRPENPAMAKIMSDTWVNFAATGNPNNPAIPEWKPYEPQQRATMVFDVPPHVENDPRSEVRALLMDAGQKA